MPDIRTFIALPATAAARQRMADIQSKLKSTHADVKWDSLDKFHITLKFLGDVDTSKTDLLSEALAHCIKLCRVSEIEFELLGTFPNIQNPRVVWIGTVYNKALLDIQSKVEQACCDLGFPKESRAFHPHITLGRVKSTRELLRLTEAIKTVTFEPIQFRCTEVLLMKSDLHQSGSIYTIVKSFSLQT